MQYYRNRIEIISFEGEIVDADSLWEKKGELMVLVDDDRYASTAYDKTKFYPMESKNIH